MKILLAHLVHHRDTPQWYQSIADAAGEGLEVIPFGLTPNPPGPRLSWLQLDALWRRKDPALMRMYEQLQLAAAGCDVLLLYNGAHLHPEMLRYLDTFNVYCCFDDPEASAGLSQPVAGAFDAVFYGNVAARFQYESWGCRKLAWLPIFVSPHDIPTPDEQQSLFTRYRDNDIIVCCDRNEYRRQRLDQLTDAFPQASCHGHGWPNGWIDRGGLAAEYRRSRIGWNIHNSTGPINQRLFTLPAFGVLQICDNKTGLGQVYKLGVEAVGFDRIDEAIDATRYYLDHPYERIEIAVGGHLRFLRDYHPTQVWKRIAQQLRDWSLDAQPALTRPRISLPTRNRRQSLWYTLADAKNAIADRSTRWLRPKRTGTSRIKPINEQAYLAPGADRAAPADDESLACRRLESVRINESAVAWAVTGLLGSARRIGVLGRSHGTLQRLLSVDPGRKVLRLDPPGGPLANRQEALDAAIWIDGLDRWQDMPRIAQHLGAMAQRVILVVPNATKTHHTTPATVRGQLVSVYHDVKLYHMPATEVPWLEPLTAKGRSNPIIACCTGPSVLSQRKAA